MTDEREVSYSYIYSCILFIYILIYLIHIYMNKIHELRDRHVRYLIHIYTHVSYSYIYSCILFIYIWIRYMSYETDTLLLMCLSIFAVRLCLVTHETDTLLLVCVSYETESDCKNRWVEYFRSTIDESTGAWGRYLNKIVLTLPLTHLSMYRYINKWLMYLINVSSSSY